MTCACKLKVARYSFSGSIPPKFEHKLRRHKQRFGKIATTVVLDKDENLLWSGLQWHRSCHSNEMTLLPILLAAVLHGTGNCSSKIVDGSFFLQQPPRYSWGLSEMCKSVIETFCDKVFMVRNTAEEWTILISGHSKSNPIKLNFNRTQSKSIHGLSSIEFGNRTKSNSPKRKKINRTQRNVRFSNSWFV